MKNFTISAALALSAFAQSAAESPQPARQAEEAAQKKKSIIGSWVSEFNVHPNRGSFVDLITINGDGTYHWIRIEYAMNGLRPERGGPTHHRTSQLELMSSGRIDLPTGSEILKVRKPSVGITTKSIVWRLSDDNTLRWDKDMTTLGGEGLEFSRVPAFAENTTTPNKAQK